MRNSAHRRMENDRFDHGDISNELQENNIPESIRGSVDFTRFKAELLRRGYQGNLYSKWLQEFVINRRGALHALGLDRPHYE